MLLEKQQRKDMIITEIQGLNKLKETLKHKIFNKR
jgi:hypothetical protein